MHSEWNRAGCKVEVRTAFDVCLDLHSFLASVLRQQLDILDSGPFAPQEIQEMSPGELARAFATVASDLDLHRLHEPVNRPGGPRCVADSDQFPCAAVDQILNRYRGKLAWREIAQSGSTPSRHLSAVEHHGKVVLCLRRRFQE